MRSRNYFLQNQRNTLIDTEKYICANTPLANALLEGGGLDSRQSRAQGRKSEEEKYVLQIQRNTFTKQRNTFTESEKYIYKTRRI